MICNRSVKPFHLEHRVGAISAVSCLAVCQDGVVALQDMQDSHCTYNVTLRPVRTGTVAVGKQYYILRVCVCVCVCSLSYPACNAHAPYCHLWPPRLYYIFPHYLINGTIFEKKNAIEHKMCVSIFITPSVRNIFHSKKTSARYDHKCILVLM